MRKLSLLFLVQVLSLVLLGVWFSDCQQPEEPPLPTDPGLEEKIVHFNRVGEWKEGEISPGEPDSARISYRKNQVIYDSKSDTSGYYRDTLNKLNFVKTKSCPCEDSLQLWEYKGEGDLDLIGITEKPPPGGGGIAITKNILLDFPELDLENNKVESYQSEKCDKVEAVKVAIVDSGVDVDSNLANNFLLSQSPWAKAPMLHACTPPMSGSTTYGLDVISLVSEPTDDNGHGTHINGIIAGINLEGGNGMGVPLQFSNIKFTRKSTQNGDLFDAVCGLYAARTEGAQVINISWGYLDGPTKEFLKNPDYTHTAIPPLIIKTFLDLAVAENILIVAGMGNNNALLDETVKFWPASFAADYINMISVGAVDGKNLRAKFSNWTTAPQMTAAALGVDVISAIPRTVGPSGAAAMSGTSMSAPFVARTGAVILGLNSSLRPIQIKDRIIATSDPVTDFPTQLRLNHKKAIEGMCEPVTVQKK